MSKNKVSRLLKLLKNYNTIFNIYHEELVEQYSTDEEKSKILNEVKELLEQEYRKLNEK